MVVKENVKLAKYTTYRIGGPARYFTDVASKEEAREAMEWAKKKKVSHFVLGGGSNVLISDKGYPGLVIFMRNRKIKFEPDHPRPKETQIFAHVDAGVDLQEFVDKVLARGLEGLEWAAGIPGQVGGAICGNAGAFGGELKDAVESVDAVTLEGKLETFTNKECKFSYRTSIFKEEPGMVIVSCTLRLKPGDKLELLRKAEELRQWRRTRHPLEYPNCGSIFKRVALEDIKVGLWERYPDMKNAVRHGQVATAYFIDKCGLKNMRIGGAEVSDKHPNFFVNRTGRASAEDVIMLAGAVRQRVLDKFGIFMEEEPHFLV